MAKEDYKCSCCEREKEVFDNSELTHLEIDGTMEEFMMITCDTCGEEVCTYCWEECGHCYSAICQNCEELDFDTTGTLACKNCFIEEEEEE